MIPSTEALPAFDERPGQAGVLPLMGDVLTMVVLGGKDRTTDEYREPLAQAGLSMTREVPTPSGFAAVEAVVAS